MPSGKKDINLAEPIIRKSKKVTIRIPDDAHKEVRKFLNDYDLKGVQELFDIVVVSGIVFRRKEILELVRDFIGKHQQAARAKKTGFLNGVSSKDEPLKDLPAYLYETDFKALNEYLIEENVKKQHLWMAIFVDGVANRDPRIIDLVKRSKGLNIQKRKKAVARLTDDKWITALPMSEASKLLEKFTEEYDNKIISENVEEFLSEEKKILIEDEDDLSLKRNQIRKARIKEIRKVVEPIEE